ncbi:MAG: FapA family protein [Clostridiales bacterium]|nr:FapA family protein [Clostridiales bacterium]
MSEEKKGNDKIVITVQDKGMKAWAKITRKEKEKITEEEVKEALIRANITCGIQEQNLQIITRSTDIYQEVLIAAGQLPQKGEDGYFEYFFERTVDTKPRILEDGSVDYHAMTRIVTVSEGDKIVEYHPATKGIDGYNIYGAILKAIPGKPLPVIKGKGFQISEDQTVYTASQTGKIEIQGDRLIITNVLEIKKDIDYLQGDIYFKGDLVIYGNVEQGKVVQADGNITIRGHVEGATVIAGKDIIFESGMQGGQKGCVISGGDVSGKFFEQVTIKAKGNITANAIMNCMVEAEGNIIVTGKYGIILGGTASALGHISASIIGNAKEIKTYLYTGVPDSIQFQIKNLEAKIGQRKERLAQIDAATEMIEEREVMGKKNPFAVQKLQLMRTKISTNAELGDLMQRREQLYDQLKTAQDARIEVNKVIYPGTIISVNGISTVITVETTGVAFVRKENKIETRNL